MFFLFQLFSNVIVIVGAVAIANVNVDISAISAAQQQQ